MKAAPQFQRQLLDVQAVDTAIAQTEHRKRSLPEHAQIAELAKRRAGILDALVAARTAVGDLELEVAKAEADLVPVHERRTRNQQRVDAGAADPKALSALIDEIAHLDRRISDLEDAQLEVMERLDAANAEQARLTDARAQIEESLRGLMASRDAQVAELDEVLAGHQGERAQLTSGIPADLLALYDRIRERSGGVGAAPLQGVRCGGCQLEATPAAIAVYHAAPDDEILRCEECDRILVREAA